MDKKQELFKYLVENSFDTPPSVRELCAALQIKSTSTVYKLLHELEAEGLVNIKKGQRRNISIAGQGTSVKVPLLGTVAAGIPILAQQNIECYINFDSPDGGGGELFALRIQGDSMIDAGILDGDIVVARRQQVAENGEIVIALLGEEATCKRLYRNGFEVELRAENPAYRTIISNEVELLGKVIAVIRYIA